MVLGEDGKWATLDARWIYTSAKTIGYLYEAQLRHNLTVALGVEWGAVRNGIADIDAHPARRAQGVLDPPRRDRGAHGDPQPALAEGGDDRRARHPPREAATTPAPLELRDRVGRARRRDGLRPDRLARRDRPRRGRRRSPTRERIAVEDRLLGADGLTAHDSSFDRQRHPPGVVRRAPGRRTDRAHRGARRARSSTAPRPRRCTSLVPGMGPVIRDAAGRTISALPPQERWTTFELLDIERRALDTARALLGTERAVCPEPSLIGALCATRRACPTNRSARSSR